MKQQAFPQGQDASTFDLCDLLSDEVYMYPSAVRPPEIVVRYNNSTCTLQYTPLGWKTIMASKPGLDLRYSKATVCPGYMFVYCRCSKVQGICLSIVGALRLFSPDTLSQLKDDQLPLGKRIDLTLQEAYWLVGSPSLEVRGKKSTTLLYLAGVCLRHCRLPLESDRFDLGIMGARSGGSRPLI
ncbi:hypothetical protein RRG08_037859 [Elysia crispata]|uniref:Uncharacterized protein n=1 Tax=Elysia crispata TaxID=231223 RepID=A0AAE0ZKY2_9GAST|nr:hypothetical protein RRG08_037859 [Elysia crispata]